MTTERQKGWAAAAEQAAADGNLAAGLFALLAQPNEKERYDSMTTWGISRPHGGRNGRVLENIRLIITDVPTDKTAHDVLMWIDDRDDSLDSAVRKVNWGHSQQLSAEGAPTVQWRER